MNRKTIQIPEELHQEVLQLARQNNMTMAEYTTACISYFVKEKIDPRKPIGIAELRETLVRFIRQQEKEYHIPMKQFSLRMENEIDAISHNVMALKTKMAEKS